MATVGEAVVAIVGDTKAFENTLKSLDRTLARLAPRMGDRVGRSLTERANDIGRRFGERLGESASRWLRRGLVVGAAGIAAVVGGTLAKGFSRFTTIEDATASLTLQLEDAGKAAGLLQDVLEVVEGTPFALDQFVDAARNLVAASIPLEKVPRILEAVGDAAAAAGGTAQDVDQVVAAIGRLATGAELTLGPIRDLEELGVPALRILANRAGKSTQDMADDISAATVDSKKAIDDLVEGIVNGTDGINGATVAFGGAAKNVGNTVRGAYDNMRIAIARAGAKVIAVFAESGESGRGLVDILNSLRDVVDILGERAEAMAERFVGSKGFGKVLDFFEDLPKRVEKVGVVKALVEGLQKGFAALPPDTLGSVFATVITKSIEGISRFIPQIVAVIVREAPAIIAAIIGGLLIAARENPLDMAIFIGALGIPGVAGALTAFFGALPFGSIVAPLIAGIGRAISAGLGAIGLKSAFAALGTKIALEAGLLSTRLGLLVIGLSAGVATALAAALAVIAGVALGTLTHLFIERFFPEINRALEDGGAAIFDFFVDHIFPFFTKTVPNFFTETIPRIVGKVVGFFKELPRKVLDGIVGGFQAVFGWFGGLAQRIIDAIGNLVGRLFDLGKAALNAVKDGAVSVVTDSGWFNFWEGVGASAVDIVNGAIDAKSPSRKFMEIGRNMVEGLQVGVSQSRGGLDKTLRDLVSPADLELSASAAREGSPAGGSHTFNIYEVGDGTATAERVLARMATG